MKGNPVAWLVGPVLFLTGLVLFFGPHQAPVPLLAVTPIDSSQIDPTPLREAIHDPPFLMVASFEKSCMDCHALFQSQSTTQFAMFQHEEIRKNLDHGLNTRCYNCHDLEARDRLVLHDGSTTGYDQVEHLCAKCHGPTYRDWERGSHGKTLGYWDRSKGDPERLTCTQCHDPHSPAFGKSSPLPGPNTLRMNQTADMNQSANGAPSADNAAVRGSDRNASGHEVFAHEGESARPNPLRRWNRPHAASADTASSESQGEPSQSGENASVMRETHSGMTGAKPTPQENGHE
jgi:hypothetical protein